MAFQILAILWGRGHPTGAGVGQPCAWGECHPSRPSSTAQRTRTKGWLWEHNGEVHMHYAGMFLKSIQEWARGSSTVPLVKKVSRISFKSHRGQRQSIGAHIYVDPVSTLWSLGQWGCPSLTRMMQWKPSFSPSFPPCPCDPWTMQWKNAFSASALVSVHRIQPHGVWTAHAEAPTGVQGLNREMIECSLFFLSVWKEKFPLNRGTVSVFGSVF